MKSFKYLILPLLFVASSCVKEFHVSVDGDDSNRGSSKKPFRTIQKASEMAHPGDVINVHKGIYRERINPPRGGDSDQSRIVYRVHPGDHVEIKGSEVVKGWESMGFGVWKVAIPDSLFGDHNPYRTNIAGDWLVDGGWNHTGEVFLNGSSLYETTSLDGVMKPVPHERSLYQEAALYTWYCESTDVETELWANFHQTDPNEAMVEITVRETCFYPDSPGRNFITVDGFHMSQAATQWAPPSAEQVGLVGTHWSKGWIIENCTIHDSKCSGLTLGKDRKSGHNGWVAGTSGADHYNEIIVKALEGSGWSMENIGGHLVRNNTIYNCEQTGICGSLGAINSQIIHNHIFNIWTKRLFFGYEIAAIKFHAPIDVLISDNRLHNAHKGLWMDWMTQGTRITANICYNNEMADLFSEVNHGPYLVDNNIFLSGIENWSEGGAYVHNLIAGNVRLQKVLDRSTPYHQPHTTAIMGLSNTTLGDDRFYNNVFIAPADEVGSGDLPGLGAYNDAGYEHPVFINNNVYFGGAEPYVDEKESVVRPDVDPGIKLVEDEGSLFLHIELDGSINSLDNPRIHTEFLGAAIRTRQRYEHPDGSPLSIHEDYFGTGRSPGHPSAGPFEDPGTGQLRLKVWDSR